MSIVGIYHIIYFFETGRNQSKKTEVKILNDSIQFWQLFKAICDQLIHKITEMCSLSNPDYCPPPPPTPPVGVGVWVKVRISLGLGANQTIALG